MSCEGGKEWNPVFGERDSIDDSLVVVGFWYFDLAGIGFGDSIFRCGRNHLVGGKRNDSPISERDCSEEGVARKSIWSPHATLVVEGRRLLWNRRIGHKAAGPVPDQRGSHRSVHSKLTSPCPGHPPSSTRCPTLPPTPVLLESIPSNPCSPSDPPTSNHSIHPAYNCSPEDDNALDYESESLAARYPPLRIRGSPQSGYGSRMR